MSLWLVSFDDRTVFSLVRLSLAIPQDVSGWTVELFKVLHCQNETLGMPVYWPHVHQLQAQGQIMLAPVDSFPKGCRFCLSFHNPFDSIPHSY